MMAELIDSEAMVATKAQIELQIISFTNIFLLLLNCLSYHSKPLEPPPSTLLANFTDNVFYRSDVSQDE